MISMIRKLTALAAFLAIGLLGTSAHADLTVTVQEGSGTIYTLVNLTGSPTGDLFGSNSKSTTDYSVKVNSAEANQTSSLSELLSAALSITNTTGATGRVLHIVITGTGYTSPTAPPPVSALSHIGGTVAVETTPSTNSLAFQSFVNGTGIGAQNPAIHAGTVSFNSDMSSTISSGLSSSGYPIKETLDVTLNDKGDQINYSSSTTLTSVPEPSSMAIAGLGALGLIGYGMRRRKALGV